MQFGQGLTLNRLAAFDASDKARRARDEVSNSLEAFTYRARDYLEDESFISVSTSAVRSTLEEKLSAASDWLYSEGAEADEQTLRSKLKELEDIVNPIINRKTEASKRPEAVKDLKETIAHLKEVEVLVDSQIKTQIAESSKSSEAVAQASASPSSSTDPMDELDDDEDTPAKPEITEVPSIYTDSDLKAVKEVVSKVSVWLDENEAKQSKLSVTDDPAFTVKEIAAEKKKLDDVAMEMMLKKMKHFKPPNQEKPKTTKPKSKTKKGKKAATKTQADSKETDKANKGVTTDGLIEALQQSGIKLDEATLKNLKTNGELSEADIDRILAQLNIGEDASMEEIRAALNKADERSVEKDEL